MTVKLPIYLDHNATTPVDSEVFEAMKPYFTEKFGNPSSVEHYYGHEAAEAVEHARAGVAGFINARPEEIIFTGSCTEANNMAIKGVLEAYPDKRHFVTSQIEHPSVMEAFRHLESRGANVEYVPVDEHGIVDPDTVKAAICEHTALVSIMAANNEIGTLQPLREIGEICRERDVLFHSDLAQASYLPIDVREMGLHLASLSAHKAYGPKGVGGLYVRSRRPRIRLRPLIHGGGQERGLRSGTVNTPLVIGMATALRRLEGLRAAETDRVRSLRDKVTSELAHRIDGLLTNGHPTQRLPHNVSFSIQGIDPHALIRSLRESVTFSATSACSTGKVKTSHVLLAMFGDCWRSRLAFRIGVGRHTTRDEIATAVDQIALGVQRLRRNYQRAANSLG